MIASALGAIDSEEACPAHAPTPQAVVIRGRGIENMIIVRSARLADLDQLLALSARTGSGMTTMPTDASTWEAKLAKSVASFAKVVEQPHGDVYFLVMQDTETDAIVGSCAVYAGVGLDRPFYSYKLSTLTTSSQQLNMTVYMRVLHLVNDYTGGTELGSLFLLPEYRRQGQGRFLSRSRLMLIADFPSRFSDQIFAEIRGWFDEKGQSPFWEHLGRKFFGLTYQKADFMSAVDGSQFISDLMPKYPVYIDLLPEAAKDAVGKVNRDAEPALKILEQEGFQYTGYVDIFDAGPCVQCPRDLIKTVQESHAAKVMRLVDDPAESEVDQSALYIISNACLEDYRLVLQPLDVLDEHQVAIGRQTAEGLQLSPGDTLRYSKLK